MPIPKRRTGEPEDLFFDGDGLGRTSERPAKSDAEEIVAAILGALENADQYLTLGETVVNQAKPALTKVFAILLDTFSGLRESLEPQLDKMSALSAKALHRDYKHYVAAGFTKEQAFKLVLAAIKPFNFGEVLTSAASNAKSKRES